MHGVIVGLARSGKDSLMRRLMGESLPKESPSTGVAEKIVQIKVEKHSVTIQASKWTRLMVYDDEAIELLKQLIAKQESGTMPDERDHHRIAESLSEQKLDETTTDSVTSDIPDSGDVMFETTSIPYTPASQTNSDNGAIAISSSVDERCSTTKPTYRSPLDIFKSALKKEGVQGLSQQLENYWSLYLTNTGGQIEFQELLPILVSGPSMFLVTFRLDKDLNQPYVVTYEDLSTVEVNTQSRSCKYTSSDTPLGVILRTLASIDVVGTYTYEDKCRTRKSVPLSQTYKVFIIGTHHDVLKESVQRNPSSLKSRIKKIDKDIQEEVKSTASHSHIEYATDEQMIFTVNNLSDDDKDFQIIRSRVDEVVQRGDFRMISPSHWLIYSLVLRQTELKKKIESYNKCFEIAQECGISDREEFDEALHFIHTKMGLIRYFPHDELKEMVVINPQVLFDKVTELIVETFTFKEVSKQTKDDFSEKGIFSLTDYKRISNQNKPDPLLCPERFLKLLEYLRIAAKFKDKEAGAVKYFFPCALSHVDKLWKNSCGDIESNPVPPLVISFKCGYCPMGVGGALIVYLIANERTKKTGSNYHWEFQPKGVFRDQVSFLIHPSYNTVILKISPTHLEIKYFPDSDETDSEEIYATCAEICEAIKDGIKDVTADINYIRNIEQTFTFYCDAKECADCRKHPAITTLTTLNEPKKLICPKDKRRKFNLPEGYKYWFQCTNNLSVGPNLQSSFKHLKPLAAKWQNIGVLLKIPGGRLETIRHDERNEADNCLRSMLNEWLKQTNPSPTWAALADAVKVFDPSKAKELRC